MKKRINEAANLVREKQRARIDHFKSKGDRFSLVTVPLLKRGVAVSCLCLVKSQTPSTNLDDLMATVQLFSVHFYGMETEKKRIRESRASLRIAGFVEAMEKAVSAEDFPECASQIVESFRVLADCDRVAFATIRLGQVQIRAISGVPSSQTTRSEGATAMETLMKNSVRKNRDLEMGNDSGTLIMPETTSLGAEKLFCAPLRHRDKAVGAWLFIWKKRPDDLDERIRFLRTASDLIGPQVSLLRRTKPGILGGIIRRLWNRANKNQRAFVMTIALGLVSMAFLPIAMPVKAACTLVPEIRRTVSAPFDGILRHSLVEPGERVKLGQLLAELDDREIRWNLADTNARILGAKKQADLARSAGQIADFQIAQLEAESLSETKKVLEYRQQNLQIKSPLEGVVLQGDLKREEGATLRMGEMLFEIGALDTMIAEIEVKDSDIALIKPSAPVKLRFDARPGESWEVKLASISPKSEYRNGDNVFICRVAVENTRDWLRPGGIGQARVSGPKRPAVWSVLRSPVNWLLQRLP